jgi:hypothetical protein
MEEVIINDILELKKKLLNIIMTSKHPYHGQGDILFIRRKIRHLNQQLKSKTYI